MQPSGLADLGSQADKVGVSGQNVGCALETTDTVSSHLAKLSKEAVSPALEMSNWTSMWLPTAAFSELCSSPSITCFLCPLASSQPPSITRLPLPEHLAFSIDMALQSLLFAQLTPGMPVKKRWQWRFMSAWDE